MDPIPFIRRSGLSILCLVLLTTAVVAPAAAHGCQRTTTAAPTTATDTTVPTTGIGTTSCSRAGTTTDSQSTEASDTTTTSQTADTQRAEDGGTHESILWKLTTIQFFSAAAMVLAAAALWAAVLAYRGTD